MVVWSPSNIRDSNDYFLHFFIGGQLSIIVLINNYDKDKRVHKLFGIQTQAQNDNSIYTTFNHGKFIFTLLIGCALIYFRTNQTTPSLFYQLIFENSCF